MCDRCAQHAATFSLLELRDAKSLLRLAGISEDAEEIDADAVVQALERHKAFLKQMRTDALVKAESEVAQIGGVLPADAAEHASGGGAAVDAVQLQAAVEGAMSRLEQRMQAFIQEEMRKAIVIIAKLDVPREAPPPPQFTAQQFRCGSLCLLTQPLVSCARIRRQRFSFAFRAIFPIRTTRRQSDQ